MKKIISFLMIIMLFSSVAFSEQKLKVDTELLNVRDSIYGNKLGMIAYGDEYAIKGSANDQNGNKWYKIDYNNANGWVHGGYVKVFNTTPSESAKGTFKTDSTILRARSGPSTSYSIKGFLVKDKVYNYYAESGVWLKIWFQDGFAWVHSDYGVKTANSVPKIGQYTVAITKLEARKSPNKNSTLRGYIKKGHAYSYYEERDSWLKIWYKGKYAWVHSGYGEKTVYGTAHKGEFEVIADGLTVRRGPGVDFNARGYLQRGSTHKYYKEKNGWLKINYNGFYSWVYSSYVIKDGEEPEPGGILGEIKINTESLRVRKEPNTSSDILGYVSQDETYSYYEKDGVWYKIDYNNEKGWVHGDFVTEFNGITANIKRTDSYSEVVKGRTLKFLASSSKSNSKYEFKLKKNGNWYTLKSYSDSKTVSYKLVDSTPFTIRVNVKHNGKMNYADIKIIPIKKEIEFKSKQGYLYKNGNVEFTSSTNGYKKPMFKYVLIKDDEQYVLRDFSKKRYFVTSFSESGTVRIRSYVKDSVTGYIGYRTKNFEVRNSSIKPIQINFSSSNYAKDEPITISIDQGQNSGVKYKVYADNGYSKKMIRDYSTNKSIEWNVEKQGTYSIVVYAKKGSAFNKFIKKIKTTKTDLTNFAKFVRLPISIAEFVDEQFGNATTYLQGSGWVTATKDEIRSELDPNNISLINGAFDGDANYNIIVDTAVLNVRSGPGTNYDILTQVYEGQKYKVLDSSGVWRKIKKGSTTGWVHSNFTKPENMESKTVEVQEHVIVKANQLNVRSGPGTSYSAISSIKKGKIYPVLSKSGNWTKLRTKQTEGWVYSPLVEQTQGVNSNMYQFLNLEGSTAITVDQLDNVLEGEGILDSMGYAFKQASDMYDVNEMYLVSHALLETGHGTSTLATGSVYTKPDGTEVVVYNMYGIGAYDSNPIVKGTEYAYNKGWFTAEEAIIGGAKWISDNYIHSSYGQNTLYKMRWNYVTHNHQYATDIGWARKQTHYISRLYKKIIGYELRFEIPMYD